MAIHNKPATESGDSVTEYLVNPDRFVYSFDIDEGAKIRSILTYNHDKSTGQSLRTFHENLIREFTEHFADRNEHSFAYHKNVRCLDAIRDHLTSDFFIKLDIHHFFESISYDLFVDIYRDVFNSNWKNKLKYFFYQGHLSIGFVSSPALSDFFMSRFDRAVSGYLAEHAGLHYSRYSDDILLSGEGDCEASLNELFRFVEGELAKLSLTINETKTRKAHLELTKKNAITFLGLNISKADGHTNKVTISKRYILFLLYLIEKNETYGGKCRELVQEINSRIAYLAYNSPVSFARFQKKYLARFGKEFDFKPGKADSGTVLNKESMPQVFSAVAADFQISLNQTLVEPKTGRVIFRNGITLEKYNGSDTVVEIPKIVNCIGKTAFAGSRVEKVILHQGVKAIDENAFSASSLQEIRLPKSIVYLGNGAFANTSSLSKINIPAGLRVIPEDCFMNSGVEKVTFADRARLTGIEKNAFQGSKLKSIALPDSVTFVAPGAFQDCADLTGYTLSANLIDIPCRAFSGCIRLKEIHIPDSILTVSDSAFEDCLNVRTVSIGRSLVNLAPTAFSGDTEISRIRISPENRCFFSNSAASIIETATKKLVFFRHKAVFDGNVEAVAAGLFAGSRVTSLDLTHLKIIESKAFKDCICLQKVRFSDSLVSIGAHAFEGCVSLKTVELPDSVTEIGEKAFSGCCNLKKAVLPDQLARIEKAVFADCPNLADVRFPASLEKICYAAFKNTKLNAIRIGRNVNRISPYAFYLGNRNLRSIVVDPDNRYYSDDNGNILLEKKTKALLLGCRSSKIRPGVKSIAPYAFRGVSGIRRLDLPESVEEVGQNAFQYCYDLQSVVLRNVYTIRQKAFEYCEKLAEVSFSPSLCSIACSAFHKTALRKVILPNSLTSLSCTAFCDNEFLEEIYIPESIRSFDATWFRGCPNIQTIRVSAGHPEFLDDPVDAVITKGGSFLFGCAHSKVEDAEVASFQPTNLHDLRGLTQITLPKSVRSIASGAFNACTELEKVTFASGTASLVPYMFRNCIALKDIDLSGVTGSIPQNAFESCISLERIDIPDDVQSIEQSAFYGCRELKTVRLPEHLRLIGGHAFENCSSLERIDFSSEVKEIGQFSFKGCAGLKEVVFRNLYGTFVFPVGAFENCTSLERVRLIDCDANIIVFQNAFANCPSLKKLDFDTSVSAIGPKAFAGDINLSFAFGDRLTEIGSNAFGDNQVITDVHLGKAVKSVAYDAFNKGRIEHISIDPLNQTYSGLDAIVEKQTGRLILATRNTHLTPGDNVSVIGSYAYAGLNMKTFTLPDFITRLEPGAFADCGSLKTFTFPRSGSFDQTLPESCFSGCSQLTTLKNHERLVSVSAKAFQDCCALEELDLPEATLDLPALYGMPNLKRVRVKAGTEDPLAFSSFPDEFSTSDGSYELVSGRTLVLGSSRTVLDDRFSSIASNAFTGVHGFETLMLPEGLRELEAFAFFRCPDIRKVCIPSTLTRIDERAFSQCDNIEEFAVDKDNPCYKSLNGHLVSKYHNKLLFAVKDRTVTDLIDLCSPAAFLNCRLASVLYISAAMTPDLADCLRPYSFSFTRVVVDPKNPLLMTDPDHKALIRKKDKSLLLQLRDGYVAEGVERLTKGSIVRAPDGVVHLSGTVKFIEPGFVSSEVSVKRFEVDPDNPFFEANDATDAILSKKTHSVMAGTETSSDMQDYHLKNTFSKTYRSNEISQPIGESSADVSLIFDELPF